MDIRTALIKRISGIARTLVVSLAGVSWGASTALAHGGEEHGAPTWSSWDITWHISGLIALFAGVYIAGIKRSPETPVWRHVVYLGGLFAIFMALQSPLDPLSEHVYALHQVTHMLLMLGPMLIALSAPQAVLVRGSPDWLKRFFLQPLIGNTGLGVFFNFLTRPVVTLVFFVVTPYFWQVPRWHDLALLNDPVHYVMHVTMILSSLTFWWRVYDVRLSPLGISYGSRMAMVWAALFANFALGLFLAFKPEILYPAYDTLGRLWGLAASSDEDLGGLTVWIPRTMMIAIGAVILMYRWGMAENRARSAAALRQTPSNAKLVVSLFAFVLFIFLGAFMATAVVRMVH